jgi:predicted lipoprotein with Yx(FWY)xxD motif
VRKLNGAVLLITGCLLVAACGSSSSSSSSGSAAGGGSTPASTSASASSGGAYSSGGSTSSSSSGGSATQVSTKHSKLGTILAAGPKHLTVYVFEADKGSKSSCQGACAAAWPPVTTSGMPETGGSAASGDLGTAMRAGGVEQVTYKGHPLYYFIKDKDDGDAYGQGAHAFGADWYALAPSGKKVDNS